MHPDLVAAMVADLLRPGWREVARPLTTPILEGDVLSRGFTMTREHSPECHVSGPSVLRALIPANLSESFNWEQAAGMLDQYHAAVASTASEVTNVS